ncbi:MAG: endolytic transglycosylase MltG [Bacillota bacterium]|nr:endolytic transglycosylase MltG [Bacillota bacterium]
MKKLVISLSLIILIILCSFIYCRGVINKPLKGNSTSEILVKNGDNFYNVLDRLDKDGIIKNKFVIKAYLKFKNVKANIKPDKYKVPDDITLPQLIEVLNTGKGNLNTVKITIPEGYEVTDIAALLDSRGVISKDDFLKSIAAYPLKPYMKSGSGIKYRLEGYLFPSTYQIKNGSTGKEIIDIMVSEFEKVMSDIQKNKNIKLSDKNIGDIITLASVVEKEGITDDDRVKVAEVFNQRLKINMKLQSDVTVLYALGVHKDVVYYKDLEVDSPYNTYKVNGLPIGPVCNPGRPAIEASINPKETKNIYFIIIKNGPHLFTSNYNEFLKVKDSIK